jgi:Leu/Phe-tRNA-protein transferase
MQAVVTNYEIGSYQVLLKYLKDRKGFIMDDPAHYCRVVSSLSKTIELQVTLDNLFENIVSDCF